MTFRAGAAVPRDCQRSTVRRTRALAPSAVRASITSVPGTDALRSRSRKFDVFGGAVRGPLSGGYCCVCAGPADAALASRTGRQEVATRDVGTVDEHSQS